jgi:hypothetical protein
MSIHEEEEASSSPLPSMSSQDVSAIPDSSSIPSPPSTSKHYPSQPPMTINTAKPALRAGAELLELVILHGQKMGNITIPELTNSGEDTTDLYSMVTTLAGNHIYARPELQSTKLLHSIFHSAHYENSSSSGDTNQDTKLNVRTLEKLRPYVSLYAIHDHVTPVWALTDKSWHDMVIVSQETLSENTNHRIVSLSTSATLFKFQWGDHTFQWELKSADSREGESQLSPVLQSAVRTSSHRSYDLQCFNTASKALVAEFTGGMRSFVLWSLPSTSPPTAAQDGLKMRTIFPEQTTSFNDQSRTSSESTPNTYNPFKNANHTNNTSAVSHFATLPFTSLLILSGLLINDHVSSLLQSLGGGSDALRLIMDPEFSRDGINESTITRPMESIADPYISRGRHHPNIRQHLDDASSISYTDGPDENGYHSSSRYSVKSIELNPGCCRCYWGYGFWWTWCPLCVPGGWCERVLCGGGRRNHRRRW